MSWRLNVLGEAALKSGEKVLRPERKTVGVLTYLALEGATPRSKIAGLLWPDSEEATARNNLSQVLRRLKKATDAVFVTGDDILSLSGLETDAAKLKVLSFEGGYGELLSLTGELLAPHDYDDCPDFADWLFAERERMTELRKNALLGEMTRLEKDGNYQEAIQFAQALIDVDTLSEDSHRHLMRLYFLAGDRAAALKAYERCESILDKELGVEPTRETQQLAKEIEAGNIRAQAATTTKSAIPLNVLRPALVGRERELAQLAEIWERNRIAFVRGEPGVGKSRLVSEFLVDRAYLRLEGRPGDALPFASYTRAVRQWLRHHKVDLQGWVKRELSRLEPSLSDDTPPSNDALRLFEAVMELLRTLKVQALVMDDVQFMDATSFDLSRYLLSNFAGTELNLIASYRRGEVADETSLMQMVDTGQAVLVDVNPLNDEMTAKLLESIHIPELKNFSNAMQRSTGGNPMFIIETVKHLIENKRLDISPDKLPSISKVSNLIQKRLEQLSPAALRLAQVAAVAGTEFDLDLASSVLETHLLELAEPFAELENNQVMRGQAFVHDLLFESTTASIPAPIKTLLHLRIARTLHTNNQLAKAAQHYLDSKSSWQEKDVPHAVAAFVEVAKSISITGNLEGGKVWFDRALDIAPDKPSRARILVQQARLLERNLKYQEAIRLLEQADHLALMADAVTRASVANARGTLLFHAYGDLEGTEKASREALILLEGVVGSEADTERATALNNLGMAAYDKRFLDQAENYHRQALELRRKLGGLEKIGSSLGNLGNTLMKRKDKYAEEILEEAATIWQTLHDQVNLTVTYNNLGLLHWEFGELSKASTYLEKAIELSRQVSAEFDLHLTYNNLGIIQFSLGHFHTAREFYLKALQQTQNKSARNIYSWNLVEVELRLGELHQAKQHLQEVFEWATNPFQVANAYWLEADLHALEERFEEAKTSYQKCIEVAREAKSPEREAEALARLARLEVDTDMAQQAIALFDVPATQAALEVAKGHYNVALETIQKTNDLFEEARLYLDIFYLSKDPKMRKAAKKLLSVLQSK